MGAGGAGRTTVAAATALADGRQGRRTLLLSEEQPGTLAALLGVPDVGTAEAEVPAVEGLWVARIDSGEHFRGGAAVLQERGRTVLGLLGADPLDEDELTELPGAGTFALLGTLRAAHASGAWDTLVVDLPPTTRALRGLALPGQLRRYLRRLLPPERQAARALRPQLAQLAGVPMPTRALYETADRWEGELAAVEDVLASAATAALLVAEPGPLAAEALRAARAGLGLYELPLEAVVANRVLPTGSADPWLASLSGQQQTVLKQLREECAAQGVPVRELPHLGRDPRGVQDIRDLAGLAGLAASAPGLGSGSGSDSGSGSGSGSGRVEDRLARDGLLVWVLPLPATRKEELDLVRRGDELI
ncbi:MAG: ArsA-related P-loop ATPase, partial [Streptomyces sp.]|uniref:ArsA family ATPase n=1 Tax=Streptomyces sp. TaxID=1931 RepID=UPI003D6B192E